MGNSLEQTSHVNINKSIFQKHLNKGNLNDKYQFKKKVYKKTGFSRTIQVFDMVFEMPRVLRQVVLTSTIAPPRKNRPSRKSTHCRSATTPI